MVCCLVCCCCCCLLLVLLLLGKARFLRGERKDFCERAGSCAEETKSIRILPEKKSIRSALCHGEVDERVDWHEVEFVIETIGM